MATRIIKIVDGSEYLGDSSKFIEYDDHIEYNDFFTKTRIYKNTIIYDVTSTDLAEIILKIMILTGLAIAILIIWILITLSPSPINQEGKTEIKQEIQTMFKPRQKYVFFE